MGAAPAARPGALRRLPQRLPAPGRLEYRRWVLPPLLPDSVRYVLANKIRTGRLATRRLRDGIIHLGLRSDFLDDILDEIEGHRRRFARDVVAMNEFVTRQGLPPIVALVLDQRPALGSRSHELTRATAAALAEAGMRVVHAGTFLARHDGESMVVSPWEGHPNARAHRLFAEDYAEALRDHPALEPCRRDLRAARTASGGASGP